MRCEFADVDAAIEYMLDPAAEQWGAFRSHYPACHQCSELVSQLTRIEERVERISDSAPHPSASELLGFMERSLPEARRIEIEGHLGRCSSCRAEVAAVHSVEAALARDPTQGPLASTGPRAEGRGWRSWLIPAPVLAAAAIAALLWLWRGGDPSPLAPAAPSTVARSGEGGVNGTPMELRDRRPTATPDEAVAAIPSSPPQEVNHEGREVEPAPPPETKLAVSPPPTTGGPPLAGDSPRASQPAPSPSRSGEPFVVAALDPALLPQGAPGFSAPSADVLDRFGVSEQVLRSAGPQAEQLEIVAPDAPIVLSASTSPSLFWFLAREIEYGYAASIVPVGESAPVWEKRFLGFLASGMHELKLSDESVQLRPGRAYLWEIGILDGDGEIDGVAVATLGITSYSAELRLALDSRPREQETKTLASAGLWLDALAAATRFVEAHPTDRRVREYRARLLESVGQTRAAASTRSETIGR